MLYFQKGKNTIYYSTKAYQMQGKHFKKPQKTQTKQTNKKIKQTNNSTKDIFYWLSHRTILQQAST